MQILRAKWLPTIAAFVLFHGLAIAQETLNNVPASIVFYPDTIVHNAKLVTMDDDTVAINSSVGTITEAMAIRDGKIMAVGTDGQILAMAGPDTERIDAGGRMVMPSVIDTHNHAHGGIANRWQDTHPDPNQTLVKNYSIPAGRSPTELVGAITVAVQHHVQSTTPGTFGLMNLGRLPRDPNAKGLEAILSPTQTWLYEGGFTKQQLDALAPNHPIFLSALPSAVANQAFVKGLADLYGNATVAGLNMDEQGRVRETVLQYGRMMSSDVYYKTRLRDLAQALEEGFDSFYTIGVTTYVSHLMGERFQDAFKLLQNENRMPVRMAFYHWQGLAAGFPDSAQFYRRMNDWTGLGGDYFWNLGISLGAIDSIMPRSCSNAEAPARLKALEFCQNAPGSRMYETTKTATENYMRVSTTHASGDKGIDYFMDAVEAAMRDNPGITLEWVRSLRLGTDHCPFSPSPAQLPRMARLGMFKSCGANLDSVRWVAEGGYPDFYVRQIAPVRTAIQAGVRITQESEGTNNFFLGAYNFITRKTRDGVVVNAAEAVDRNTALKMFTNWAAWSVFREDKLGSLEPGKFADYIVLNKDYFEVPEEEIKTIYPLMTVMQGKILMLRKEFASELGRDPIGPQRDWNAPEPVGRGGGDGF